MDRYELRGESTPSEVTGTRTVRWHIARPKTRIGLCEFRLAPGSALLSIALVEGIPRAERCTVCWALAVSDVLLPP